MRSLCSADVHMCCEQYNKYWERCHGSTAMRNVHCCDSCRCYNVKHNSVFTWSARYVCPNLTKSAVYRHIFVRVLLNVDRQTDMKLKGRLSPLTRTHLRSPDPNWWFLFPHPRHNTINVLIFRRIIPVLFYVQLNSGSFESKHNYLMLLSSFKLTTCFGPCNGPSSGHNIQGPSKRFEHLLLWPPRSPDLTPCDFFPMGIR